MKTLVKILSFTMLLAVTVDIAQAQVEQPKLTADYLLKENTLSAQDNAAINQIIVRLNHAVDFSNYEIYASFFAEQSVFNTAFGQAKGPEQIIMALEQSRPYISGKRHVASNIVINGKGNIAEVVSYLTVYEATTSLTYLGSAVNVDRLEKKNGKWEVVYHTTYMDPATIKAMQN